MKLTNILAVAILAVNTILVGTFAYSVATQTPDVEPWASIARVTDTDK